MAGGGRRRAGRRSVVNRSSFSPIDLGGDARRRRKRLRSISGPASHPRRTARAAHPTATPVWASSGGRPAENRVDAPRRCGPDGLPVPLPERLLCRGGPRANLETMARARLSRRVAIAAVVAMLLPCSAAAAAPLNDNYLASTRMLDPAGNFPTNSERHGGRLDRDHAGRPVRLRRAGRAARRWSAGEHALRRSRVREHGLVRLRAAAGGRCRADASGFDTVIAVYEYDVETAKIVKQLACFNESSGTAEDLPLPTGVVKGHAYTVQVGRVASSAPGPTTLSFAFRFFPDRDSDGVLDAEPDRCLELPGISGRPPRSTPRPVGHGGRRDRASA